MYDCYELKVQYTFFYLNLYELSLISKKSPGFPLNTTVHFLLIRLRSVDRINPDLLSLAKNSKRHFEFSSSSAAGGCGGGAFRDFPFDDFRLDVSSEN